MKNPIYIEVIVNDCPVIINLTLATQIYPYHDPDEDGIAIVWNMKNKDSVFNEVVYLGITYNQIKEKLL